MVKKFGRSKYLTKNSFDVLSFVAHLKSLSLKTTYFT